MTPKIMKSSMTGKYYIVTKQAKDGSAIEKFDVTDYIETQIKEALKKEK